MPNQKIFDRGDIIHIELNPTKGREQQGKRYAIVLSKKAFNALGLSLLAPITQGGNFARTAGFSVPLVGAGTKAQGVILINQLRMLDSRERNAKKLETAPEYIIEEALAKARTILD